MTKHVSLWSGPRNISTTMMYSFAQREDTTVIDEPLYGHYLAKTDAKFYHPGAEEVMKEQDTNGNNVLQEILQKEQSSLYFLKNMTHHLIDINRDCFDKMYHILLTRDPREVLLSYHKVIEDIAMKDVGYEDQAQLMQFFREKNIPFLVIDSRRVLLNPEFHLRKICSFLEVPFRKNMLSWEKGPVKEDGSWAKYWYKSIHESTGFKPYQEKDEKLPEELRDLYNECKPYYNQLLDVAVKDHS